MIERDLKGKQIEILKTNAVSVWISALIMKTAIAYIADQE